MSLRPIGHRQQIIAALLQNNFGSTAVNPLNTSAFYAPLTHSAILTRGSGNPTFVRATTKYITDFEGRLVQCASGEIGFSGARRVHNFVGASSEVLTAVGGWTLSNATSVVGATDPVGGTTAYTLTATAGSGFIYNGDPVVVGGAIGGSRVGSVWVRRRTGTGTVNFQLGAAPIVDITSFVTSSWRRISTGVISSASSSAERRILIQLVTNGDAIDIWRPQGEVVTGQTNQNPSEYVSVGVLSAPYHGAGIDGARWFNTLNANTVSSNVVTEATGAAIDSGEAACAGGVTAGVVDATGPVGYNADGVRTNRCLHSQDFSNAAWVSGGGGIAVTANSIAAPDGTTTADTLTASGANGTLIQDLGVVASAAKAGGLWLKRKTGTGNIDITLDGGATWTTVAVTSSWARFEKTQTLADEDFGIRIVTSGDEVYAWQGQVETAAFLSSDIPTTTVAVQRNADVLTYASSGNVLDAVGSAYIEFYSPKATSTSGYLLASAIANIVPIYHNGSSINYFDGTNNTAATGITVANSTLEKIAASWTGSAFRQANAGVSASNDPRTFDGGFAFGANITFMGNALGVEFGNIRNARIWTTALTDAQLTTITTP